MGEAQLTLARQLVALWGHLLDHGAKVTVVPLDSPEDVLRSRIAGERRRLYALAEGAA